MRHLRLALFPVLLWLAGPTAPAAASGIPVFDGAAFTQAIQDYITMTEQLTTLQSQLQQLEQSYQTLAAQYQTITNMWNEMRGITEHARMLGDSVASWHDWLPNSAGISALWQGPLGQLATRLRQRYEQFSAETLFDGAAPQIASAKAAYQARSDYIYGYLAAAQQAYEAARDRRGALEALGTAATTATTEKAILDLIARTNAEAVLVQNDLVQMMALQFVAQLQRESLDHNADAANRQRILSPEDFDFSTSADSAGG